MNEPIDVQIITEDGDAKFAVVPIDQFRELIARAEMQPAVPHAVVRRLVDDDVSPIRAWREYLGLTQRQVAERLDISQAAFAQKEKPSANLRPKTLKAVAGALGIHEAQLDI